jgi:hypothetical protein
VKDLTIFELNTPAMKHLFTIAFFLLLNIIHAQVDGVEWKKEKLFSEFVLNGKIQLNYGIELISDSVSILKYFEDGMWQKQEQIEHTGWLLRKLNDNKILSEFKVSDFDNDGDDDLICWVDTSAHGNVWTVIYLNDQKQKRLVKLNNSADGTDVWDEPEYDNKIKIINCTLGGGAYGSSEESTFKLNNLTATPLTKHRQERYNPKYIEDFYYIGKNGKWKLSKHERTSE